MHMWSRVTGLAPTALLAGAATPGEAPGQAWQTFAPGTRVRTLSPLMGRQDQGVVLETVGTSMVEAIEDADPHDPADQTWTEARIRNAITLGEEAYPYGLRRHVTLLARRTPHGKQPRRIGALSTPLTRVAMAASHARRAGTRLRVADVKAEWVEPTLRVYVCALVDEDGMGTPPIRVSLRPAGGAPDGTLTSTVAADRVMPIPAEYHQMFFEHHQVTVDHGVLAIFPLSALRAGHEVYVEYLEATPLCTGCAAALPAQPAERGR